MSPLRIGIVGARFAADLHATNLEDFVSAISERREPLSGALLAREVVEVIYAGYLSAATGRRVELPRP